MSKVLKVLSLSFLLCLSLVIAPFHISANESLPAPFIGANVYAWDYEQRETGNIFIYKVGEDYRMEVKGLTIATGYLWHFDLVLDSNYVGDVTISYPSGNNTVTNTYYINGNHLEFNLMQSPSTMLTISNLNLTDLGNGNSWVFPIESIGAIGPCLNRGLKLNSSLFNGQYIFPVFEVSNGDILLEYSLSGNANDVNHDKYFIFGLGSNDIYNDTTLNRYISNSNSDGLFTYISNPYVLRINGINRKIVIAKLSNNNTSNISGQLTYSGSTSTWFIPVYYNQTQFKNISTDFALTFGLSNDFLDAVVYGTESSNQSVSNLGDKTSDLNTSSNQLVTQEDAFNDDMNSALQDIDTDFNVGTNFGSKFIASADWVKTQYDRLTGNTPFGSVISFSLLIGLALLLVGKVFK